MGFFHYPIAVLLILALFGCGGPVSRTIDAQIKAESGGNGVDLRQVSGFDWDKLLVFGPYSYPTQICHEIGLSASECDNAKLKDVDEGQHLIVFLVGGRVTYHEEVSRRIVNFDEDILAKPIAKSEAMFLLERGSGGSPYLMHPMASKRALQLKRDEGAHL
ncbi:hypothetical protein [Candidatus Nitrospira allomarina]|uniref:Uncharacterized protein n=1 Tax=Candidatus Nitrospira allomarina TaxID=3020900 RepID=A0AA96JRP3_9BACT|nr:hypothetical protein [Candidatus Nitrospira allomarina]WNM57732.1 hypothetical protein PP769_17440 [Candidatus Nitrospira allomarina]